MREIVTAYRTHRFARNDAHGIDSRMLIWFDSGLNWLLLGAMLRM
jgi:hypothetical protein